MTEGGAIATAKKKTKSSVEELKTTIRLAKK